MSVIAIGAAGSVVSAEPLRAAACPLRLEPPTVDGVLSDDVWHDLDEHGGFVVTGERSPHYGFRATAPRGDTTFRIFRGPDTVYLGVIARSPADQDGARSADAEVPAGLYSDCIRVFWTASGGGEEILVLEVDRTGRASIAEPGRAAMPYAGPVGVQRDEGFWSAEIGLPVERFGLTVEGQVVSWNVARFRMEGGGPPELSYWMEFEGVSDAPCRRSLLFIGSPPALPTAYEVKALPQAAAIDATLDLVARGGASELDVTMSVGEHPHADSAEARVRLGSEGRGSVLSRLAVGKSGPTELRFIISAPGGAGTYTFSRPFFGWDWRQLGGRLDALKAQCTQIANHAETLPPITTEEASVWFYADWLAYQFEHATFSPERLSAWLDEAEQLAAGTMHLRDRPGLQNRAVWSELDQSLQPYTLWVPRSYTPDRAWPVVVVLHGGMPDDGSWSAPYWENERSPYQAIRTLDGHHVGRWLTVDLRDEFILLAPRARRGGCQPWWDAYEGPAEDDVLAAIDDAARTHHIDRDRIHVMGLSLGGWGATSLATKMPGRWASAVANCVGWKEFRHRNPNWADWPAHRQFVAMRYNPVDLAESLTHVPFFFQLSEKDQSAALGRPLATRLQQIGAHHLFWERLGGQHCDTFEWGPQTIRHWLTTHTRAALPRRVRHKTATLRHGSCHWLTVQQFETPGAFASVDAWVAEDGSIEVHSQNVARLSLSLGDALVAPGERVAVRWNHATVFDGALPPDGVITTGPHGAVTASEGEKSPRREGPIADAVMQPFMLVVGTEGTPVAGAANRQAAERFGALWFKAQGVLPRHKTDAEVTPSDVARFNLICFGGPDSNRMVREAAASLPFRFLDDGFAFGEQEFRGPSLGLRAVYPNPTNPQRLLQINAGSPEAMKRLADITVDFDFVVFDADVAGKGIQQVPELRACGWFDQHWRFDARHLHAGGRRRSGEER
ncbi:MAG: prolyl oligopeptidase family serine peptidase [Planctomycetes bacterium]|nr:prolyl oligopeptidase family serine peptidase [Planctomycetota bacterium]